jgi:uncharacterized protein YjbI with pentapeptide repeats
MLLSYHADQSFDKLDGTAAPFPKGEYEGCTFSTCNLADANLAGCKFIDCTFTDSNLSLANLTNTALRGVAFVGCKLTGLRFDPCNAFGLALRFERCTLDLTSFYALKLRGTAFRGCTLREADFTETDLTSVDFTDCDLTGALFDRTVLEKADFRTAHGYTLDPEHNRIRGAKFTSAGLAGLLGRYGIEVVD